MSVSERHKILLIDDDQDILEVVSELLEKENFEVLKTQSAQQALQWISDGLEPSLTICDINMPQMNGPQFVKKCLSIKPGTPIAMLTAYSNPEIIEEALQLGALECILKPFRSAEFIKKTNALIQSAKIDRSEESKS